MTYFYLAKPPRVSSFRCVSRGAKPSKGASTAKCYAIQMLARLVRRMLEPNWQPWWTLRNLSLLIRRNIQQTISLPSYIQEIHQYVNSCRHTRIETKHFTRKYPRVNSHNLIRYANRRNTLLHTCYRPSAIAAAKMPSVVVRCLSRNSYWSKS